MSKYDDLVLGFGNGAGTGDGKLFVLKPTDGNGDFDVSRASEKRVLLNGVLTLVEDNFPSMTEFGGDCPILLTEPATDNEYVNPETLVTQDIATIADVYTVSFYGTGTIDFTGSFTGQLVGTGANERVTITFTATAGTLTSTVTGSVTFAKAEQRSYATSYSEGSTVADAITGAEAAFNDNIGILQLDFAALFNTGTNRSISINDGTSDERIELRYDATNDTIKGVFVAGGVGMSLSGTVADPTVLNYAQLLWNGSYGALRINGIIVAQTDAREEPTGLTTCDFNIGFGGLPFYGYTKELNVYDTTDSFSLQFETFNAMATFAKYDLV